ncbi:hypothetical protein CR513_07756, partial [Mucuna pruriens]
MNLTFHNLIDMEVYIDESIVKSANFYYHLADLKQPFSRIRKHGLKMNMTKKIELQRLIGNINFLSCSIANLTAKMKRERKTLCEGRKLQDDLENIKKAIVVRLVLIPLLKMCLLKAAISFLIFRSLFSFVTI